MIVSLRIKVFNLCVSGLNGSESGIDRNTSWERGGGSNLTISFEENESESIV